MDARKTKRSPQLAEVRPEIPLQMAKTDKVPVFLTGQSDWETPAFTCSREQAREKKIGLLGKFENHGRTFRLFQTVAERLQTFTDGPFGIGNLLPFSKSQNKLMAPEHLHYSIPAVGAHAHGTSAPSFWRPPVEAPIVLEAFS